MGKEAVVFVLDANGTMSKRYPSSGSGTSTTTTRLQIAKDALQSMISDLMLKSKTNEVSVIVTKTATTSHHMIASGVDQELEETDDIPMKNITELTPGVTRPSVELLRRIAKIECASETTTKEGSSSLQGDLCSAIIVAADALYERGPKLKFERKIVIITDAEHEVVMDVRQTLMVIDSLRGMNCRLEVVGLEFGSAAVFEEKLSAERAIKAEPDDAESSGGTEPNKRARIKEEESPASTDEKNTGGTEHEDDASNDEAEEDGENFRVYSTKAEVEELLISLTEKTGGEVVSACNQQQVLERDKGKKVRSSVKFKFDFRMAPGLSIEARHFALMKAEAFPTLKTAAVALDTKTGDVIRDEGGNEVMDPIQKVTPYVDQDDPELSIFDSNDMTQAIQFGSTLVPMSSYDYEGLKAGEQGARMEIIGYLDRQKVDLAYTKGPPSGISGHDSQKACAAVSSLAQALHRQEKVAIASFYKTTRSTAPTLVALFPFVKPEYPHPLHLVLLQIPFEGEVKRPSLANLEDEVAEAQSKVCDDLIDSLILPKDALQSGTVPSPFLRSWNQTQIKRALDPLCDIVKVRRPSDDDDDRMVTPASILERAKPAVQAFEEAFPLSKKAEEKKTTKGQNGKNIVTFRDYNA